MSDIGGKPNIISQGSVENFASQAGFSNTIMVAKSKYAPGDLTQLQTIVGIAHAESNFDTNAWNASDPNGGSYGIVQINGAHFFSGGTTLSCALDPHCAMQYAYTLSAHGTNFLAWGTFTNGSYLQYARQVTGGEVSKGQTPAQIFTDKKLEQWWNEPHANYFGQSGELGQDYGMTGGFNTPVGAISGGTVEWVGTNGSSNCGSPDSIGWIVQLTSSSGDGMHHYQHLTSTNLKAGDLVNVGDIIGLSGGCAGGQANQRAGGGCGCYDQFSAGNHIEVRWSPDGYHKGKGWNAAGNWKDPLSHFKSLAANSISNPSATGASAPPQGPIASFINNITNLKGVPVPHLAPDASVIEALNIIDDLMMVVNPIPSTQEDPNLNFTINIPGAGNQSIPNPLEWFNDFIYNLFVVDYVAIMLRLFITFIGFYICFKVFNAITGNAVGKAVNTGANVAKGAIALAGV